MSKAVLRQDPFFGGMLDEARKEGFGAGDAARAIDDLKLIFQAKDWEMSEEIERAASEADDRVLKDMMKSAVILDTVDSFVERFHIPQYAGSYRR